MKQEAGPRQTPNLLVPLSQTSQLPELQEINVCYATLSMVFLLKQPDWTKKVLFISLTLSSHFSVIFLVVVHSRLFVALSSNLLSFPS